MKIRELDKKYDDLINVFRDFFNKNFENINDDIIVVIDNEDLWFELIHKDYRYGFIIEKDVNESSFYFVSNKKYGELSVSGLLSDDSMLEIIKIIQNKIKNHGKQENI